MAVTCWLLIAVAGCGGTPEQTIIRELQAAYEETVASVSKAETLETIKESLDAQDKKRDRVIEKFKKLTKDQQKAVEKDLDKEIGPAEKKLNKALDTFYQKFHANAKEGPLPQVEMDTSMGVVKIELYDKIAPGTVKNFLRYVDEKHYDGKMFHRVIPDFMIQGGGFETGGLLKPERKTHDAIANESYNGLLNERGTLAMARTGEPHSATDQFFINVKDNDFLNRKEARDGFGYTVFAKVVSGMDVVDKIRVVETRDVGGHEKVPVKDVIIKSMRRIDQK